MDVAIQNEINILLEQLKFYRALPHNEIIASKELIIQIFDNINNRLHPNIKSIIENETLSLFYFVNDNRLSYFDDLYRLRWDSIEDELLKLEQLCLIIYAFYKLPDNEVTEKFELILNIDSDAENQNTKIIEDFINWLSDTTEKGIKSIQYFDDEYSQLFIKAITELLGDLKDFKYKFPLFIHELTNKMINIPRSLKTDQFIRFDQYQLNKRKIHTELSSEILKKLIDDSIVILMELQAPSLIDEQGERVLINLVDDNHSQKGIQQSLNDMVLKLLEEKEKEKGNNGIADNPACSPKENGNQNHSLNTEELEILKLRKHLLENTLENIGLKMNPKIKKNSMKQHSKNLRNKLGANTIDEAVRIFEDKFYKL